MIFVFFPATPSNAVMGWSMEMLVSRLHLSAVKRHVPCLLHSNSMRWAVRPTSTIRKLLDRLESLL